MLAEDKGIAAALIRQGMVPCTPFGPKHAVSMRLLAIYKNLHCRCPQLSIQSFLKGSLDMQGVRKFMRNSFSILT